MGGALFELMSQVKFRSEKGEHGALEREYRLWCSRSDISPGELFDDILLQKGEESWGNERWETFG